MWLGIALCLLIVLDAWRLRSRLSALESITGTDARPEPSPHPASPSFVVVPAPNVALDAATQDAARNFATARGLDAVDLVPGRWCAKDAFAFAQFVDPAGLREAFAPLRTAGVALLVSSDVLARAHGEAPRPDALAFFRFGAEVKRCASRTTGIAVAPGLSGPAHSGHDRAVLFRKMLGGAGPVALVVPPLLYALLALACWMHLCAGLAAVALFHLQPVVALMGAPIRCPDLPLYAPLRLLFDLASWANVVLRPNELATQHRLEVDRKRPAYAEALSGGVAAFFEEPRTTCPLCDKTAFRKVITTPDRIQHKPGLFTLMSCKACGHVFQNPRLSIAGLSFYYRDFYDGLGEASTEAIFGYGKAPYLARASMLTNVATPRRWLDVGAGHGHFCLVAREVWPQTSFDGLDFSDGVDLAVRRRWMDKGIRGLFPERAEELAGAYDVVSMSHYLEHTRDPRAEIAAAAAVVAKGGHLLIEVPDPSSRLGKVLRTFWVPWFQPQHQHFVSTEKLGAMLREHGFTPILWHRGPAHQRVDFVFAALLLIRAISRQPDLPWRPPSSPATRALHGLAWTLGFPLVILGFVVDRGLGPLFSRPGWSNTYRVLARRGP